MFLGLKSRINIKYFMLGYLGLLLAAAVWNAGQPFWLIKGLAIAALYDAFDLAWTRLRDHVWYLPLSSGISGFVLSVAAVPNPPWWLIVVLPALAVISKQLLHFGKTRHVFNPAAFAMCVASLFAPVVSWWAPTWGTPALIFAAVAGLFILWRQSRWHVAIPFWAVYLLGSFALLVSHGANLSAASGTFSALTNGALVFFSTVMLIEPITSNFPAPWQRSVYGALVGGFVIASTFLLSTIFVQTFLDPLVVGLLLGNLTASLLFLPSQQKVQTAKP